MRSALWEVAINRQHYVVSFVFFFQAEDGIRDVAVTGVQTCALPISFTLRLSYGAVKGYTENGKRVTPFTTLGGLYERSEKFKAQFPYNLPPRWLEKK